MIKPEDVWNRNINIYPYEKVIDSTLSAPWTEEMKQKGRKVSLQLPSNVAHDAAVLPVPSAAQLERLRTKYQSGGWVFRDEPNNPCIWVFQFPKGKTL